MGNSPEICRRHYAALMPEKMRETVEFESQATHQTGGSEKVESMFQDILDKLDGKKPEGKPKLRLVSFRD